MSPKPRHAPAAHRWDEPPLSDLLGQVPDWLVAMVAGTNQSNVVFVRKARGIKAQTGGLEGDAIGETREPGGMRREAHGPQPQPDGCPRQDPARDDDHAEGQDEPQVDT